MNSLQSSDAVNTVPSSSQQVAECRRTLTPLELYQVAICRTFYFNYQEQNNIRSRNTEHIKHVKCPFCQTAPLLVDFGSVCLQSVCIQDLQLINRLPAYVWVELEGDCPELQGSSLLSQVLPPYSQSSLPLMFQSSQLGPFYRLVHLYTRD